VARQFIKISPCSKLNKTPLDVCFLPYRAVCICAGGTSSPATHAAVLTHVLHPLTYSGAPPQPASLTCITKSFPRYTTNWKYNYYQHERGEYIIVYYVCTDVSLQNVRFAKLRYCEREVCTRRGVFRTLRRMVKFESACIMSWILVFEVKSLEKFDFVRIQSWN
jgi:hypothetical protein